MKKRYKALIVISLCLNIFLLGFIAGEIRRIQPKREGSGIVKEFKESRKEQHNQLNKERTHALQMLQSKNFDQETYLLQIDKVSKMQNEMFKEFSIEMGAKLRAMPKNERDEIIERLKKRRGGPNHPSKK